MAGIFEYDKSLKQRGQYRQFLFQISQMKEIISLSEEIKLASKFLYRLKYVRDIMLHPTIDDPGITAINSMITFTSGEICSKIITEEKYVIQLFLTIYPDISSDLLEQFPNAASSLVAESGNNNVSGAFEGILFLKELMNLSKFMSYDRRLELFKKFFSVYKVIFLKVLLFVLSGATRALHFRILPENKESKVTYREESHNSSLPSREAISNSTACSATDLKQLNSDTGGSSECLNGLGPVDDSFEQETVKDNLTERLGSCDSMEEMAGKASTNWSPRYEELFTYSQSLESINHLADIISTIAFTYPSLFRTAVLDGNHPVLASMTSNIDAIEEAMTPRKSESTSSEHLRDWMSSSFLFLIIDNIVNGKDITAIELFGETLKAIIDFDKQLNAPNLALGQNASVNASQSSNLNSAFLNQVKLEKDKFLPLFYDHYYVWLIAPYLDDNNPAQSIPNAYYLNKGIVLFPTTLGESNFPMKKSSNALANLSAIPENLQDVSSQSSFAIITSRRLIIEITMICVLSHSYRIKYFLMKGNHITRIINKCTTGGSTSVSPVSSICDPLCFKSLQLYSIKFLKCLLMTKDEFYYRHIEKTDGFKGVILLLQKVSSKDNLISSAIFDLIEFIRAENLVILICYLMKKYSAVFDDLVLAHSVDSLDKLKVKYLQIKDKEEHPRLFDPSETPVTSSGVADSNLPRTRKRQLSTSARSAQLHRMAEQDDEEDYFDESDEEEADEGTADLEIDRKESNRASPLNEDDANQVNKRARILSPLAVEETANPDANSSHSVSPRFLESLRHKSVPSKPSSPPHYSQRMHGSPVDGEISLAPGYRHSPTPPVVLSHLTGPLTKIDQNDAISLLQDYDAADIPDSTNSQQSANHPVEDRHIFLPMRVSRDDDDDIVAPVFSAGKALSQNKQ